MFMSRLRWRPPRPQHRASEASIGYRQETRAGTQARARLATACLRRLRPFQPALASSIRPSTFFGNMPIG